MNCYSVIFPVSRRCLGGEQIIREVFESIHFSRIINGNLRVFYFKGNAERFNTLSLNGKEEQLLFKKQLSTIEDVERIFPVSNVPCSVMYCPVLKNNPIVRTTIASASDAGNFYLTILPKQYTGYKRLKVKIGANETTLMRSNEDCPSVLKWLINHLSPKRFFDRNHKHAKVAKLHKGKIVSPIKCSDSEAQQLLNRAINFSNSSLVAFDTKRNECVVFKRHSKDHYHAYYPGIMPNMTRECKAAMNLISSI